MAINTYSIFGNSWLYLADEQKAIYEKITAAIRSDQGGVFFLNGYGGTEKTFMWRTLASALRSKGEIVLTVASSGIASLLLPGGRTAHSKFKIPVPTFENSTCNINGESDHAELLRQTKLIIWDEAPMCHKYTFETLDRTLRDVVKDEEDKNKIFGGKVVVFGGDFRQILPVIPRGSRSDIVHASINASKIWDHCQVLTLTKNMRLQNNSENGDSKETSDFAKWILEVGEGKISEPNDGHADIKIPPELLIPKSDKPIKDIVDSTYPDFLEHYQDVNFLDSRAILASTIETVDEINEYMLGLIPGNIQLCLFCTIPKRFLNYEATYVYTIYIIAGEEQIYLSSNSIERSDVNDPAIYEFMTPEFLNSLRTSGLPNHQIKLKIGTPIMLMRNLDQAE
jgi:ATP-dependent DNA helicase PIF1